MQKLWTFIEECGVVLIAFEDEVLALPQSKAGSKIFGDAADQERRIQSGSLKNPGQHGCGRRLAMSAGNHDRFASTEKALMQDLRQGSKRDVVVEHMLQLNITAGNRISHNY